MNNGPITPSNSFFEKTFLTYCRVLPKPWNRSILTHFEILLQRISDLTKYYKLPAYLLSGKEKYSGEPFTVFYAGSPDSIYYLSCRMFDGQYTIKKMGAFSILYLKKLMKLLPTSVDIVIVKTDIFFARFLQKCQFTTIPEWINMVVDSSQSLEELTHHFSSGARKDIKKITRYGYSYEVTNDLKKMGYFYQRMFLPYILDRYGEETTCHYLKYIQMILQRNTMKLLLVKDGDTYISGGLIDIKGKKEILPSMGVLDPHVKYLKKYASSALFYFHILSAKKRGIVSINYGDTRTFLDDGNYQFKRKWGMNVIPSRFRGGLFGLKIIGNNTSVSSFLAKNPFICMEHKRLRGYIYVHNGQPTTLSDLQNVCRTYYTPGIAELVIISTQGFTKKAKEAKLFEGSSKYHFVKTIMPDTFLHQNVEVCVIGKQAPASKSFSVK